MSGARPRVGVVGAGALGFHHVRIMRELPDLEFVGFHESRPERAADELASLVRAAGETVSAVTDAQTRASDAFASMQAVVDGTELRAIREKVEALEPAVAEIGRRVDEREQLEAARAKAVADLADLQQKFDRLKVAAGGRAMKKAGLE